MTVITAIVRDPDGAHWVFIYPQQVPVAGPFATYAEADDAEQEMSNRLHWGAALVEANSLADMLLGKALLDQMETF